MWLSSIATLHVVPDMGRETHLGPQSNPPRLCVFVWFLLAPGGSGPLTEYMTGVSD
jgi:hypothetical protein